MKLRKNLVEVDLPQDCDSKKGGSGIGSSNYLRDNFLSRVGVPS